MQYWKFKFRKMELYETGFTGNVDIEMNGDVLDK